MSIAQKTKAELDAKVKDLENFIAKNGIGSSYLSRAEKIQRNVNIGLFIGGVALIGGIVAYSFLRSDEDDE